MWLKQRTLILKLCVWSCTKMSSPVLHVSILFCCKCFIWALWHHAIIQLDKRTRQWDRFISSDQVLVNFAPSAGDIPSIPSRQLLVHEAWLPCNNFINTFRLRSGGIALKWVDWSRTGGYYMYACRPGADNVVSVGGAVTFDVHRGQCDQKLSL